MNRMNCVLRNKSLSRERKHPTFFLSVHRCKHGEEELTELVVDNDSGKAGFPWDDAPLSRSPPSLPPSLPPSPPSLSPPLLSLPLSPSPSLSLSFSFSLSLLSFPLLSSHLYLLSSLSVSLRLFHLFFSSLCFCAMACSVLCRCVMCLELNSVFR